MRNINLVNAPKEAKVRLQKVLSAQKHIDEILKLTFNELPTLIKENGEESHINNPSHSRLLFPTYGDGTTTRYSEQELRFLFVEKFNQYVRDHDLEWYYSIETPTRAKYSGMSASNPNPQKDEKGQSAMIDLVIYDAKRCRLALIEFKANNPDKLCFDKDFVKLREEYILQKEDEKSDKPYAYFVMYLTAHDTGTINNLKDKKTIKKSPNTHFWCFDVSNKEYLWPEKLRKP